MSETKSMHDAAQYLNESTQDHYEFTPAGEDGLHFSFVGEDFEDFIPEKQVYLMCSVVANAKFNVVREVRDKMS